MQRWVKGRWIALLFLLLLTGCQSERVLVAGSSCMGRMMAGLAEGYRQQGGGAVEVQLGGSELGLLLLAQGSCDIASCSSDPSGRKGILFEPVAIDSIAVVVHPSNPVTDLSRAQLLGIYRGEITDWSEVGGEQRPIVVIGREAGSGTRHAFEAGIGLAGGAKHAQEQCETGILRTAVSIAKGAIGYLSFEYAKEEAGVKVVSVEGAFPQEGPTRYPLSRSLYLCVREGEQQESVLRFFAYCQSEEGQALLRSLGMLDREGEAA